MFCRFLIKENEARDQANRGYQTNVEPETVIKQDENGKPETPKFIRTVLQVSSVISSFRKNCVTAITYYSALRNYKTTKELVHF